MFGESSETIPQGSRGSDNTDPEMVETLMYFYVLKDPRTNLIRYVGRTVYPHKRLIHHISEAKAKNRNYRERWIVSLLRRNLKPIMEVFYKEHCTQAEAAKMEATFIKKIGKRFELVNGVDRGLGFTNVVKKCYQYTIDGVYITSFQNVNRAEIATGIKGCNIARCCKNENGYGSKSAGGYLWSYIYYETYPHDYKANKAVELRKAVICTDANGNITEFVSAREAERQTGISFKKISACITGRQKSTRGLFWKLKS